MKFMIIISYLVCLIISCLEIIKVYEKMKLFKNHVSLEGNGLAQRWSALGHVRHAEGSVRRAVVLVRGGPVVVVPGGIQKFLNNQVFE